MPKFDSAECFHFEEEIKTTLVKLTGSEKLETITKYFIEQD